MEVDRRLNEQELVDTRHVRSSRDASQFRRVAGSTQPTASVICRETITRKNKNGECALTTYFPSLQPIALFNLEGGFVGGDRWQRVLRRALSDQPTAPIPQAAWLPTARTARQPQQQLKMRRRKSRRRKSVVMESARCARHAVRGNQVDHIHPLRRRQSRARHRRRRVRMTLR